MKFLDKWDEIKEDLANEFIQRIKKEIEVNKK